MGVHAESFGDNFGVEADEQVPVDEPGGAQGLGRDGQPTLRRRIKLGTFAALDQRIALRYAMPGMTPDETGTYIAHHLQLAGRTDTLFSDDAIALIHQVARGLPRAVNNLAVQALVAAYATSRSIVDEDSARAAFTEVTAE